MLRGAVVKLASISLKSIELMIEYGESRMILNDGKQVFVSVCDEMKCLACKHNRFKKGTIVLPIERGNAILLITGIPARVCENCGETYLDEEIAQEVQDLANETLSGEVSYAKARGKREVLVTTFS
jgi:YgiT-type zinc finger domain-containing protein